MAITFLAAVQASVLIKPEFSIGVEREFSPNPEYAHSPDSDTGESMDRILQQINKARLGYFVHLHLIRYSTGFYLAMKGDDRRKIQACLGPRQIQHTVRYTQLAPGQFEGMWDKSELFNRLK